MISANDFSRSFEFTLYGLCSHSPYGARIVSYHNAYHGRKYDFLDFWIQRDSDGKPHCALCRYYSTLIICGKSCDKSELRAFIGVLPLSDIMCDYEHSPELSERFSVGETMVCRRTLPCNTDYCGIKKLPSDMSGLRKIYELLCRADGSLLLDDFEPYFLDMSHKIRHLAAEVYAVYDDNNNPVSTASVLAVSDTSAVIGCVATDLESRNKGYATAIVRYITDIQISMGREVFLHREKKITLYDKIGYTVCGTWQEYTRSSR